MGATEKLSIAKPVAGVMHDVPVLGVSEVCSDASLVRPLGVMLCKGWSRCVAAVTVMVYCWKSEEFLKARCIHVLVFCFSVVSYLQSFHSDWIVSNRFRVSLVAMIGRPCLTRSNRWAPKSFSARQSELETQSLL